jgi:hypothetical protein
MGCVHPDISCSQKKLIHVKGKIYNFFFFKICTYITRVEVPSNHGIQVPGGIEFPPHPWAFPRKASNAAH